MIAFNFVDYFLQYTRDMESPTEFFRWAALSALTTVVRNNVFLSRAHLTTYPNMYVLLFARSGAARKSVPMKTILPLLRHLHNTHLVNGRSSVQGVIQTLAQDFTNKSNGEIVKGASGLLYAEELASFVVQDPATIGILTDLADWHAEWSNNLVSRDPVTLKNVCVSMLAATNEQLFREVYTKSAVYGGLLGRTLVIHADKARHKNAMVREVDIMPDLPLIEHLQNVAKLKGNFTMTERAIETYEKWYETTDFDSEESATGLEARLSTHVKKVAMALRLAEAPVGLDLHTVHIERAIEQVMSLVPTYRLIVSGAGTTEITKVSSLLLTSLLREALKNQANHALTRSSLLQKHWSETDVDTFDKALNTLSHAGYVKITSSGQIIRYSATEKAIEMYTKRKTNAIPK